MFLLFTEPPGVPPYLFYVTLAVCVIVFVIYRLTDAEAVQRGALGATDGAVNLASICFFLLLIGGLCFYLSEPDTTTPTMGVTPTSTATVKTKRN